MTDALSLDDLGTNTLSALLLSPTESDRTPVDVLARGGYDRLLAVTRDGRGESILDAWWTSGQTADVGVVVVGGEMRSVCESRGADASGVFLHGIEHGSLVEIHRAFSEFETRWSDAAGRTALYVDGIADMLSADGIGTTYNRVRSVCRRASQSGPTAFGCLPAATPEPVKAGIATLFDTVLGLERRDGAPAVVRQPRPVGYSYDRVFELLGPARRRAALRVLDQANEPLGIDNLAQAVAPRVAQAPTDDTVDRLRTHFYQTDLPKLAEAGVVEFERQLRRVSLRPSAIQLWPCLSTAAAADARQP